MGSWLVGPRPRAGHDRAGRRTIERTAGRTSLADAQALCRDPTRPCRSAESRSPSATARREDEHLRLLAKQEAGCRFFVTQVVYDVNAAKNLVSDYHYECRARGVPPVPFVFTFSVCGSMKTLEFLRWLGVDVPRWIENDLAHAADPLDASYEQALTDSHRADGLLPRRSAFPFGINVESVSIRRVEIEASVRLAEQLRAHLHRPGYPCPDQDSNLGPTP